ncbi:conserved hypothetical protein [Rhodopseudomonas palustris TIE-1]|uniref:hypothetical protein n=1 Tax=Rhodopseudomonas palustris TaxID=1076 RepID=UPI000164B410|nr:hypothetical protein [Rhodopseudomonas palustris]ACF02805.1 conserved hypothetical protein [Rhodopseudomonas palustris TIE-1]
MSLLARLMIAAAVSALASTGHAQSAQPGLRPGAELLQPQLAKSCPPSGAEPSTTESVSTKQFVVAQLFRESAAVRSSVAISWLGTTFKQRFVDKVEPAPTHTILQPFHLRRPARASEIVAWLGDRGETSLGEMWCLLSLQPNGESGALLTNATPNLFFIRDRDGKLWTVDVLWGGPGWEIGASAVDGDRPWDAGAQAFSR